ncbi:DUF6193 family natural product biosynthesis protein [Streptomyces goshikiensis]|uniref:DUF6193 family natural product biosynthesis protein n=1 Tax=Streptomyces goshikiensis TaxID=1942 RepID=UPI0036A85F51
MSGESRATSSSRTTLFPLVSHGTLQFSRCTQFPWSQDLPSIFPAGSGGFRILRLFSEVVWFV